MPGLPILAACLIASTLHGTAALAHDPAQHKGGRPDPADGAVTRIEATIAPEGTEVPVLTVKRGTRVLLAIHGSGTAELHLHGYDIGAAGTAGAPAELLFQADHEGRYPIEMHLEGDLLGRSERPVVYVEVRGE